MELRHSAFSASTTKPLAVRKGQSTCILEVNNNRVATNAKGVMTMNAVEMFQWIKDKDELRGIGDTAAAILVLAQIIADKEADNE